MIAIASDHGGYPLKEHIKAYLAAKGITCQDFGTDSTESCDYPAFGKAAAQAVASGQCQWGIVICTTGIGISIAANKVRGIRCALCGAIYTRATASCSYRRCRNTTSAWNMYVPRRILPYALKRSTGAIP